MTGDRSLPGDAQDELVDTPLGRRCDAAKSQDGLLRAYRDARRQIEATRQVLAEIDAAQCPRFRQRRSVLPTSRAGTGPRWITWMPRCVVGGE